MDKGLCGGQRSPKAKAEGALEIVNANITSVSNLLTSTLFAKILHKSFVFHQDMDWTGGTRRRYAGKGKGNAVLQRQKAHFAKARAALGQQVHVVPERFLQNAAASREYQPRMAAGTAPHVERASFQGSKSRGQSSNASRSIQNTQRAASRSKRPISTELKGTKPSVALSEEDLALIANRERLLARDDWLGLAPTRPVKIIFPSYGEQEQIGKRRKIQKQEARSHQPAELRPVPYQFEGRHEPFEPVMSGARETDDIKIKIGTDALLSQTQRSRRSHDSTNTSLRPISSNFGPISEESMLLKADSDGFEAREILRSDHLDDFQKSLPGLRQRNEQHAREGWNYIYSSDKHQNYISAPRLETLSLDEGERSTNPGSSESDKPADHRSANIEARSKAAADRFAGHRGLADRFPSNIDIELDHDAGINMHQHVKVLPDHERGYRESVPEAYSNNEFSSEQSGVRKPLSLSRDIDRHLKARDYQFTAALPMMDRYRPQSGGDENDEQVWRDFMHIRQAAPISVSLAALRSSSPHVTQATVTMRPADSIIEVDSSDEMLDDHDGLDGDDEPHSPAFHPQDNLVSTAISSPSPSHRQILQLVNQPPAAKAAREKDGDQDELWRQYILGSQSSQSQSSCNGRPGAQTKCSEQLLPAPLSSVVSANEHICSDRVTTGGSIYAAATLGQHDEVSSQDHVNTSLAGNATTVGPESNIDFEESDLVPRKRRKTTNIHADEHDRALKRRYWPRKRVEYAPVPRADPRVLINEGALAQPRSIYDLSTSSD